MIVLVDFRTSDRIPTSMQQRSPSVLGQVLGKEVLKLFGLRKLPRRLRSLEDVDSIGVLQCNTGRVLPSMLDGAQKEHQFFTGYRSRPESPHSSDSTH